MRKGAPLPSFPDYLRQAIAQAGYPTYTEFARAANISPSVASRWLSGAIRPTIPLLERVAPHLGANLSTLVRIAYPEIDAGLPLGDDGHQLHPLAAELDRLLGGGSKLSSADRDILTRLIDSVLGGYRNGARRRAG